MRPPRAWRLAGVTALLALLVSPGLPGATGGRVLAHAQLVASSPGAGEIVAESPDELRLIFSERLEAQITSLDIVGEDGTAVATRVGEIDPDDPYALVVAEPDLPDGIYSVTWRTLSADDGHTAEGFFSFGVGEVTGALPGGGHGEMTHSERDPVALTGRWLTYLGLLFALGVAVFHRVVIRAGPMPRLLRRVLGGGLLVAAGATLVVAVVAGARAESVSGYLFESRSGTLQLTRALVAAVGGTLLFVVTPRLAGMVAAATGLLGIVVLVISGHAAALPGPVPVIGQVVHVAAAAVWLGGIASLLAVLVRPDLLTGRTDRPGMRELVPRFSALALVSIGLVGLSGVYAAWMQTGAILTVETEYGRTLLVKTGLATGALTLGGLNYLDGGRMIGWLDGMRTRLTVETTAAAAVLLVTAALAITPPIEEVGGVPIEPIPDAFGTVAPGLEMEVVPGRPGVNRIVVSTTDALAMSSILELSLDRLDTGATTRVPLVLGEMAGMDHGDGASGMGHATADGTARWTADALVLPADSRWDTSVRILDAAAATEYSRQRFGFTMSDVGIDAGRVRPLLDPVTGVALVLAFGGAVGLGLGAGGMRLPRCERTASRVALIAGGGVAVVLGGLIGWSRYLA